MGKPKGASLAAIREAYGVTLPDELEAAWELARTIDRTRPRHAFGEDFMLVGPFDMLEGRVSPRPLLEWRYFRDPPELVTWAVGNIDGLHWGFVADDPAKLPRFVTHNYGNDSAENDCDGATFFSSLMRHLDASLESLRGYRDEDARTYDPLIARVEKLRETVLAFVSIHELDAKTTRGDQRRRAATVAETIDQLGVVAPKKAAGKPLGGHAELVRAKLPSVKKLARKALEVVDETPAVTLQTGRDLWWAGAEDREQLAVELMSAAYERLGRPQLAKIAAEHVRERRRPSLSKLP